MKAALIKQENIRGNQRAGDVADILPDTHSFSPTELSLFTIQDVSDEAVAALNASISTYMQGLTEEQRMQTRIRRYYDGELKWEVAA